MVGDNLFFFFEQEIIGFLSGWRCLRGRLVVARRWHGDDGPVRHANPKPVAYRYRCGRKQVATGPSSWLPASLPLLLGVATREQEQQPPHHTFVTNHIKALFVYVGTGRERLRIISGLYKFVNGLTGTPPLLHNDGVVLVPRVPVLQQHESCARQCVDFGVAYVALFRVDNPFFHLKFFGVPIHAI